MNTAVSTLAEQAKALKAAERVALAEMLLESVQESGDSEIRALLIPSEEVYAKAKNSLRETPSFSPGG
jgi:hypothetical protein